MRPIIVGLDPGTTSAFALLDTDLNVIKIKSRKEYPMDEIISDVCSHGIPIIVGCDKKDLPSAIKEFSQRTGAKIHLTSYDTKKDEKKVMVKNNGFWDIVNNAHEIDSLASAIMAFNDYKKMFQKAKRLCEENNRKDIEDALIVKTIMEERNLADSFIELTRTEVKVEPAIKIRHVQTAVSKEYLENLALKETINELEEENSQLKKENEMIKDKKIDIPGKVKSIISFKEQRALVLESKNRKMKKDIMLKESIIEKLNSFIIRSDSKRIVKILDNLGSEEYAQKKSLLGIKKKDILYVKDISIISHVVVDEIRGCVVLTDVPKAIKGIDVIKDISTDKNKFFALADEEEMQKELRALRKKDTLKDILDDYKKERLKEIV